MSSRDASPQALGQAQIDADTGRVDLPDALAEWDVLSPGSGAFWAHEPTSDRLVVTRSQERLDEQPDLTRIDETRVTEDGSLELLPATTSPGDEFPWSGYFADADTCYFDAPGDMLSDQLAYVLTDEQHDAFWND